MVTKKSKSDSTDYPTLLGYVAELNIKIFSSNYIECNFTDSELLGSGNSMNVYHGYLHKDPNSHADELIPVAIKVPKANIKDMNHDSKAFKVLDNVRQELRMMKHFETHPNIINLYGVFFQELKPLTIVEIAEDSITDYLSTKKENGTPLDWETKARFCCEVADGLQALHVAKIVHGDLKGDNILLFKDSEDENKLIAKITDFGYSATTASIEQGSSTGGSLHFLAPECTIHTPMNMREYKDKPFKDKYAFGLFVWQVVKDGEIPYEEMDRDEIHDLKSADKNLDELMSHLGEDTPQYFKDVILSMTKYSPEERGNLTKVREMMEDASFAAVKIDLELYARELPHNVVKADPLSIELMTIPASLKTKIYRSYERAAASDDANAMFMMAVCHSKGFAVEIDNQKGLEWCVKAANAGSLNAMINLAENYDIKNIPVEPEVAFPWYLKAAEEGYRNAINKVINCYANGVGIKRSITRKGYWSAILKIIPSTMEMNIDISESLLHRAARLGDVEATRLLVNKRADIFTKNKEGETALHIAAQYGHTEVARQLITGLADTKAKTNSKRTALQLAAIRGHVDVVQLLDSESPITKLDFSHINLSREESLLLIESLKLFPTLTQLNLQGNKMDKEEINALIGYLKQNSTFTKLNLGLVGMDIKGVYALGEYLRQDSTLAQLDLQFNNIGNDGLCILAVFLEQNSSLTQLNLASNAIGEDGAYALAEFLEQNSTLTELILQNNYVRDDGACALAECLKKNKTLKRLTLEHNEINSKGVGALAECLKQNMTLKELNLEHNLIGKEGASALAECLKQNSTITYLGLNHCRVDKEGASALGKYLEQNSTLTHLELGNNLIDDEGISTLAQCLKQNSTLMLLNLGDNDFGDEGACAIAEYLKNNSTLTHLNIENNLIGNEGGCALAECLEKASTLRQLNLKSNKIEDEGASALLECLKQNSTLKELDIGYNALSDETKTLLKKTKIFTLS